MEVAQVDAASSRFAGWVKEQRLRHFELHGGASGMDLLNLRTLEDTTSGTRPVLQDLIAIKEVVMLALGLGPTATRHTIENVLVEVHEKAPLREPKKEDDRYWLHWKAKKIWQIRSMT